MPQGNPQGYTIGGIDPMAFAMGLAAGKAQMAPLTMPGQVPVQPQAPVPTAPIPQTPETFMFPDGQSVPFAGPQAPPVMPSDAVTPTVQGGGFLNKQVDPNMALFVANALGGLAATAAQPEGERARFGADIASDAINNLSSQFLLQQLALQGQALGGATMGGAGTGAGGGGGAGVPFL